MIRGAFRGMFSLLFLLVVAFAVLVVICAFDVQVPGLFVYFAGPVVLFAVMAAFAGGDQR